MPGIFNKSARPKRPGAYFNFLAEAAPGVLPSVGGVVAIPIVHDWGPFKLPTAVDSFAEFEAIFGTTHDQGYVAVHGAFKGEGIAGRGGAGRVIVYRFGGSAAAKATVSVSNTLPAAAVRIDARYEGTRGNSLSIEVVASANVGKKLLRIYDGTLKVEEYETGVVGTGVLTALIADVNANSDWVTATALGGSQDLLLNDTALTPLASGNSGTTLIQADWQAVFDALTVERFSLFAPFDLTDTATVAALKSWVTTNNEKGKRFMAVIGGLAAETATTANTRSTTQNSENMINLGVGSVIDSQFGTLSTSQLASRLAGIIANRGEKQGLSFARFAGLTSIVSGITDTQVDAAIDAGTIVLTRDSHLDAPIRVEKGLTTYTSNTATKPKAIFSVPKFVRTMHAIEMELTEYAEQNIIGLLPINQITTDTVVAEFRARLRSREPAILTTGTTVAVAATSLPTDDFIDLDYNLVFARSLEQVFSTVRVG